jgi:hypothetical protein
MLTFDDGLRVLLAAGRITLDAARRAATKKEDFESAADAGPAPAGSPAPERRA